MLKNQSFIKKRTLNFHISEGNFLDDNQNKMTEETSQKTNDYKAESIQVLSGLEPVRKRPGMFIGSTDVRGLHHIVFEVVDNSVDEALAGYCTQITVTIHADGSASVKDNGRGIPVDIHPKEGVSALQVVMTVLHAGGKFERSSYKVSGGLHGVGVSVTNALSKKLIAQVMRDGKIHQQEYDQGKPVYPVKIIGDTNERGTIVRFYPDPEIFETLEFKFEILASRLKELAYLNKGLEIILIDERDNKKEIFKYQGGIKELIENLNKSKEKISPIIYLEKEKDGITAEVAFQYVETYDEKIFSFANNINTHEGGTHLTGFRTALTRSLNNYAEKNNFTKETKLSSEDFKEGLVAVVSIKIPNPQFEGQTKTKLGNSEVKGIIDTVVNEFLSSFLMENPSISKQIIIKAINAAQAREAARKAKDLVRRKSIFEGATLPGKLADCSSNDPTVCELYLVEGDSAGGTCKSGRNRNYQAILPLKGKILNVEKSRLVKVLKNEEITAMITAIGTGIGDDFDIAKLRYHKIVIMTDADVDGNHIACLLLTFFYRYMNQLIEAGKIYLAQPPLYKMQKGRKVVYAYNDEEKKKLLQELGQDVGIQRYKGLGEMNASQLWETTMDPKVRTLKQIRIEDAVSADETFSMLMGDDVAPRKQFILDHAKEVEELDV